MAQGLAIIVVGMHDRFQADAFLAGFAQAVVIGNHCRIVHQQIKFVVAFFNAREFFE